ncbi:rRNA (cytosine-C5-)-methyltransferase nop2 [Savitreella phatthalungensis]
MGRRQRNKQADPPSFDAVGKKPQKGKTYSAANTAAAAANKKRKLDHGPSSNAAAPTKRQANGSKSTSAAPQPSRKGIPAPAPADSGDSDDAETDDFAGFDDEDEGSADDDDAEDDDVVAVERKALFDSDSDPESEIDEEDDDFLADGSDVNDEEVMQSDEDEETAERGLFSDSDDEEELTLANMEAMSRKIDARAAEDAELAEQEMQEVGMRGPKVLPDAEEEAEAAEARAEGDDDLSVVSGRLQDVVRVLGDFKQLGEPGRSRSDYLEQFERDVRTYFGYSEYLASRFCEFFPPAEALAFFEANETPRPIVIRVNTLKTTKRELSKALIDRGVNLGEVGKWTKCALQIYESSVPIGATPEYMAGHYILQAASSLVPVLALQPQAGDKVLDMASAPGGKTSFLAQEMENAGVVVANEVSKRRQKALVGNVVRLGCKNVVCVGFDGREFGSADGKTGLGLFDKVLLDAPCSGTGVIHKDPSVKTNRTEKDFRVVSQLQRQLLLSAIDATKVGGVVVYSTCSVMPDEDEMVVDYALRNREIKLEPVSEYVSIGEPGLVKFRQKAFHRDLHLTRRYYPHVHNMDGFFVARIRKIGKGKAATPAALRKGAQVETALADDDDAASASDVASDDDDVAVAPRKSVFEESGEDAAMIATSRRAQLKKRGMDPRSRMRGSTGKVAVESNAEDLADRPTAPKGGRKAPKKSVLDPSANKKRPAVVDWSKQKPTTK